MTNSVIAGQFQSERAPLESANYEESNSMQESCSLDPNSIFAVTKSFFYAHWWLFCGEIASSEELTLASNCTVQKENPFSERLLCNNH